MAERGDLVGDHQGENETFTEWPPDCVFGGNLVLSLEEMVKKIYIISTRTRWMQVSLNTLKAEAIQILGKTCAYFCQTSDPTRFEISVRYTHTIGSTKEARFEVWKKGHMKLNFPNDRFVWKCIVSFISQSINENKTTDYAHQLIWTPLGVVALFFSSTM